MNRILLIIILCISVNSYAQNNDISKAYEDFKLQKLQNFTDFRKQVNNVYSEFMKYAWSQFNANPALPKPNDKEISPITIKNDKQKIDNNPISINDIISPVIHEKQPEPITPIKECSLPNEEIAEFIYFGTKCRVRVNKDINIPLDEANNANIANAWFSLSNNNAMDNTIHDCIALRNNLKLCDWAYLNMLHTLFTHTCSNGNKATMLTAYTYCQSGYDMRLARKNNILRMLFACQHKIYGMPYYDINGKYYYPFNCNDKQLDICNIAYEQEKPLSLFITQSQRFTNNPTPIRNLISKRYPNINIDIKVNKNVIDFYNTYPSSEVNNDFMTRWMIYANTPLDENVKKDLYPALKEKIHGLSKLDAANKLLNWIQTAFKYEYDEKVWGYDRAFFAEETLYYPYCDCEDRAILFTRIVRDLLKLETVLVYYPGHLASAVCFTEPVPGDFIMLHEKCFVIADPTYIGAPIGITMPDMNNKQASIILLD